MKEHEAREDEAAEIAARLARALGDRGLTVAVAESLTGGKIANQLAAAPDSSEWFAGAVVCYWSDVKHRVLDVPDGPVISERAVEVMARNVAALLGTDTSVAASGRADRVRRRGRHRAPPGWRSASAGRSAPNSITSTGSRSTCSRRRNGPPSCCWSAKRRSSCGTALPRARNDTNSRPVSKPGSTGCGAFTWVYDRSHLSSERPRHETSRG